MLRGFRWQLVATLIAASLFVVSLLVRSSTDPDTLPPSLLTGAPTPTVTPSPSPTQTPQVGVLLTPEVQSAAIPTFREALVGNVQRLNPLLSGHNPVDQTITSLIFEGLTRHNAYGEPEPALAKEWVISSDGLEYVVRLRDDVLWQDGLPFTAADVIYTMKMLRSPDFPGPSELGTFWRTVEIQELGPHLVRFRLTQPLASFLSALSIGLLPEHVLRGTEAGQLHSHPFNLSPIGTGPYQLEALRSEEGIGVQMVDLRVAPVYRLRQEGQQGYALERVSFYLYDTFDSALEALQVGQVDGLGARGRHERLPLLTSPNVDVLTALEPTLGILIFNWDAEETSFFREQRVRMALETGLNRKSIIERQLPNLAVKADSPLLPGSWAYTEELDWPNYDPAVARQLLETAHLSTSDAAEEADTAPSDLYLNFQIMVPDDEALVRVAEEIATQWSQLNSTVSVDVAALDRYQQRLESNDFDVALVELVLGVDPDVYAYWHEGQYPDGQNYGGVNDRRISELLERGRTDASGINRAIYYRDFQHEFVDRAIALPLYYPLYSYAVASHISGVQLGLMSHPTDRFRTIQSWDIQQAD